MKIAIDIDGVLADYHTALIGWHNDVYDTNYRVSEVRSFNFDECFGGTQKEWDGKVDLFSKSPWFDRIKPIPNAREVIAQLSADHSLSIVTARMSTTSSATNRFVTRHFPSVVGIYYTNHGASPKVETCKRIGASLLIEDGARNAEACALEGIPVLLYDQPWNQKCEMTDIIRVYGWYEILDEIARMK